MVGVSYPLFQVEQVSVDVESPADVGSAVQCVFFSGISP